MAPDMRCTPAPAASVRQLGIRRVCVCFLVFHFCCCVGGSQQTSPPSVDPSLALKPPVDIPRDVDFEGAPVDLSGRHFLSLKDFTSTEVRQLLSTAAKLKKWYRSQSPGLAAEFQPLLGEAIGMIFQKPSTRTRVSTEMGMTKLGGHALFLSSRDIQLGSSESVEDTARVLSRFNSILLARVFEHEDVETLAQHSSVPVINALRSGHCCVDPHAAVFLHACLRILTWFVVFMVSMVCFLYCLACPAPVKRTTLCKRWRTFSHCKRRSGNKTCLARPWPGWVTATTSCTRSCWDAHMSA